MKPPWHTCGSEKKKIMFLLNQYVKAVQNHLSNYECEEKL